MLISAQKLYWFNVSEVSKIGCNISVSQNSSRIKPFHLKLDGEMRKYLENHFQKILSGNQQNNCIKPRDRQKQNWQI